MIRPRCAVADVINGTSRMRSGQKRGSKSVFEDRGQCITIGFESVDHGDGSPFDGPNGILAHAFPPTDGRFHYDADEPWSVAANPGSFHLETVALHEIGHLLGLGHSSIEGAVMYSSIRPGESKGLHGDDIQGINALYNF
ncbi:hypothetical protein V6N13_047980 [Hibiscus sabdariffa]|uniref:Peptidase metallopeptidase domain-containing protein n=1 Tax=Hibiscus sabdariffa TaxID=183260 RepID=A0ABR2F5V8_9ROSI